jgi:hypothetical protein
MIRKIASWFVGRMIEILLGSVLIILWGKIVQQDSPWRGFTSNYMMALGACLTYQILSGYVVTTALLYYKLMQTNIRMFLYAAVGLFIFHFIVFNIIAGPMEYRSIAVLLVLGAVATFVSNLVALSFFNKALPLSSA